MKPPETTYTPDRIWSDRRLAIGLGIALWIITYLLYLPAAQFEFISFDDPLFVTHNEHVNQGFTAAGLRWAFTAADIDYWRPLSWVSHMLDVEIFGMDPGGHHRTSVLIHAFNAVILFLVCLQFRFGTPGAILVAGLFAWHPLHVESVAWVAERKDVLCAFFWFLSLLFYARYAQTGMKRFYAITLMAFGLGLMSKPMIVTLPFQLLLLDYWPLDRARKREDWKNLALEKIPFVALTVISSIFAYTAQVGAGEMAQGTVPELSFRIGNAMIAYSDYLKHSVWPVGLGVFYPYPDALPTVQLAIASLVLFIGFYLAILYAREQPQIIVGWLFFLGTIVPVVGILKVGGQASADRYTYVATTGLFWVIAVLLFPYGKKIRPMSAVAAGAILLGMLVLSHQQIRHWQNNITLFSHTVSVTENNWVMMNNLARAHLQQGNTAAAAQLYEQALKIKPFVFAHFYLAQIHHAEGRIADAERHYLAALELDAESVPINHSLGEFYRRQNKREPALHYFRNVLKLSPEHEQAQRSIAELTAGSPATSTTQ